MGSLLLRGAYFGALRLALAEAKRPRCGSRASARAASARGVCERGGRNLAVVVKSRRTPKWKPCRRHGLRAAVLWWFHFDPKNLNEGGNAGF